MTVLNNYDIKADIINKSWDNDKDKRLVVEGDFSHRYDTKLFIPDSEVEVK